MRVVNPRYVAPAKPAALTKAQRQSLRGALASLLASWDEDQEWIDLHELTAALRTATAATVPPDRYTAADVAEALREAGHAVIT
jgi:hypothetical protein